MDGNTTWVQGVFNKVIVSSALSSLHLHGGLSSQKEGDTGKAAASPSVGSGGTSLW